MHKAGQQRRWKKDNFQATKLPGPALKWSLPSTEQSSLTGKNSASRQDVARLSLLKRLGSCWPCRIAIEPETIRSRLRELAFLNSSATIWYRRLDQLEQDADGEEWVQYHFSGGLQEFVKWTNRDREPMHKPIFIQKEVRDAESQAHAVYNNVHIIASRLSMTATAIDVCVLFLIASSTPRDVSGWSSWL